MKKILISSIVVSLLLLGCGSGDSDTDEKTSIDDALKIGDVAFSAPSGVNFKNKMRTSLKSSQKNIYTKYLFLNSKKETANCSELGTLSLEETSIKTVITSNKCTNFNDETYLYEYHDGVISITKDGNSIVAQNYWYIPNIENMTGSFMNIYMDYRVNGTISNISMDGEMKEFSNGDITSDMSFNRLAMKEDSSNGALFLDGGYKYKEGCVDESYQFKTREWLIPNSSNQEEYTSGVITVNGMTYTYEGSKVTVTDKDRSGTFNQSELNAEMESQTNSTECGSK